jgi:hypothetical protein
MHMSSKQGEILGRSKPREMSYVPVMVKVASIAWKLITTEESRQVQNYWFRRGGYRNKGTRPEKPVLDWSLGKMIPPARKLCRKGKRRLYDTTLTNEGECHKTSRHSFNIRLWMKRRQASAFHDGKDAESRDAYRPDANTSSESSRNEPRDAIREDSGILTPSVARYFSILLPRTLTPRQNKVI